MEKLNIEQIMEIVNRGGYFGVRGLAQEDTDKKYRLNQFIAKSYSHYDGEREYQLNGTSAVGISDLMDEDEIIEAIGSAKKYSSNGRVILIAGDTQFDGMDDGEMVIANEHGFTYRGAKYLGDIDA